MSFTGSRREVTPETGAAQGPYFLPGRMLGGTRISSNQNSLPGGFPPLASSWAHLFRYPLMRQRAALFIALLSVTVFRLKLENNIKGEYEVSFLSNGDLNLIAS